MAAPTTGLMTTSGNAVRNVFGYRLKKTKLAPSPAYPPIPRSQRERSDILKDKVWNTTYPVPYTYINFLVNADKK